MTLETKDVFSISFIMVPLPVLVEVFYIIHIYLYPLNVPLNLPECWDLGLIPVPSLSTFLKIFSLNVSVVKDISTMIETKKNWSVENECYDIYITSTNSTFVKYFFKRTDYTSSVKMLQNASFQSQVKYTKSII